MQLNRLMKFITVVNRTDSLKASQNTESKQHVKNNVNLGWAW